MTQASLQQPPPGVARVTFLRALQVAALRPDSFGDAVVQIAFIAAVYDRASSSQRAALRVAAADEAGLLRRARSRKTKTMVAVYKAAEQGIECDPETPFAVVCETHGTVVCVKTRRDAFGCAPDPTMFCDDCREAEARGGSAAS
jgi:hypothetical protein